MVERAELLAGLQRLLKKLEGDLRTRSEEVPEVAANLKAQYEQAKAAQRTSAAYPVWREEIVTQVGVAGILGCVFIRFLEDNDLLNQPFLSGPGPRLQLARDQNTLYFRQHPTHSDRDYLEHVFHSVAQLPGPGRTLLLGAQTALAFWALRRCGGRTASLLAASGTGHRRAPPRFHRPELGHPVSRRPLSGPFGGRPEALRLAPDPGLCGGVHPGPHAHAFKKLSLSSALA